MWTPRCGQPDFEVSILIPHPFLYIIDLTYDNAKIQLFVTSAFIDATVL